MLTFIIFILGVSLLLYTLLGGADFGAGILETFSGRKGINTISKAIAPIWEANHIWLILAVVILFNGFPPIYTTVSIYLHIPLMIVLTGIIFRGTAFTFRYYDVIKDNTGELYTKFFRFSSFLTPMFLGIILGSLSLGSIPAEIDGFTFYEAYIKPWFNLYTISFGIFTTLLFGTLAGVYLIGEAKDDEEKSLFVNISKWLFIALIISGGLVFLMAHFRGLSLLKEYLTHWLSITMVVLATLTIPVTFWSIRNAKVLLSRLAVGFQVTLILGAYMATSFPVVIKFQGGGVLSIIEAAAPDATLKQLVFALVAGVLIIIPALVYLFSVFKMKTDTE